MFRRFMGLSLIVIKLLIRFRQSDIEHGAFRLFRFQLQRIECRAVLAYFREETHKIVLHHHTAVVVKKLNILRERTGRHIPFDGFRLDR